MSIYKVNKGNLLIASPEFGTKDFFAKTVILIADHNIKGSVGFVLNRPQKFTLQDLIPEIKNKFKIYNGGPIEQESLYFLHKVPHLIANSVKICDGVYWGGDFAVIKDLLNNNEITNKDIKFFLGYTGWGVHQLEDELEEEHWILDSYTKHEDLFESQLSNIWKNKIIEHCPEFAIWINAPINPTFN